MRRVDRPAAGSIPAHLVGPLLAVVPDAAVVVDERGTVVAANRRAEVLFGFPPGSLAGTPVEALLPGGLQQRHRRHRASFAASPQARQMGPCLDLVCRRRDGSELAVAVSLAPMESEGRHLVVASVHGLGARHPPAAVTAARSAVVRTSREAIVTATPDGVIASWNPGAERLLGYSAEEMVGRHLSVLLPDREATGLAALLEPARRGSQGIVDTRWFDRTGRAVDVALSLSPIGDGADEVTGYSLIARDVTDRRRTERRLRRLLAREERRQRQLTATAAVRLRLLSGASLSETLTLICKQAQELVASPAAMICRLDYDGLRVVATGGPAATMVGTRLAPGSSLSERLTAGNRVMELASPAAGPSVQGPKAALDGPTLGIPIVVNGVARGALVLVRSGEARPFDQDDCSFAETLASQAGLAFEFERAREDREQRMLGDDRERIARDLHDLVIQHLFAAGMTLQGTLGQVDEPPVRERLRGTIDVLDETIREIRSTIFALGASEAGPGFRAQVLRLVGSADDVLGFRPSVRFDGPVDAAMPERVAPHALAVVREALSNVARHARARSVRLHVGVTRAGVVVRVVDDGVGLPRSVHRRGLANLEARAELFGGTCDVSQRAGGGTCLEWRVPVEPVPAAGTSGAG